MKIVEQMLVIQHKKVMQTLGCGAAIIVRKHGISIAERQERRVPDQTTEAFPLRIPIFIVPFYVF